MNPLKTYRWGALAFALVMLFIIWDRSEHGPPMKTWVAWVVGVGIALQIYRFVASIFRK